MRRRLAIIRISAFLRTSVAYYAELVDRRSAPRECLSQAGRFSRPIVTEQDAGRGETGSILDASLGTVGYTPTRCVFTSAEREVARFRMADLDDLTGLLSRAAFFRRMEEAMASSNLHGVPLCLLVADLDFLKSINDHYGHLAGDTALQVVAGALRAILRGDDVGGRYGGDEFVILLSGVSIEGGLAVAERLRAAAGEAAFTPPGSTASLRLSLSIGVAAYPLHGHERERVFAAADRAAYAAKEAGRNTARVASEIIPPPPAASPLSPRLDQSRLVGRHDEIRRLRTGLEAACQGRGGVLIVEGEAGIGKTRLVEEVA